MIEWLEHGAQNHKTADLLFGFCSSLALGSVIIRKFASLLEEKSIIQLIYCFMFRSDIIMVPDEARKPACRFRWWQPAHSGGGRDLWAVDGISINNHLFNTINLEMADYRNDTRQIVTNLGTFSHSYCGDRTSMRYMMIAIHDLAKLLSSTL
jgi:hypothetical protein